MAQTNYFMSYLHRRKKKWNFSIFITIYTVLVKDLLGLNAYYECTFIKVYEFPEFIFNGIGICTIIMQNKFAWMLIKKDGFWPILFIFGLQNSLGYSMVWIIKWDVLHSDICIE